MFVLQRVLAGAVWLLALIVLTQVLRQRGKRWPATVWFVLTGIPVYLFVCWFGMLDARETQGVFYGRMMAGPPATLFALASAACIVGTSALLVGWSWAGLRVNSSKYRVWPGAVGLAVMWWVIWQHPTPHYVPVPDWQDNAAWAMILGGVVAVTAIAPRLMPKVLKLTPLLAWAGVLLIVMFGIPGTLGAHYWGQRPVELATADGVQQIEAFGCLVCHEYAEPGTGESEGYGEPGGPLEAACSRPKPKLRAFLLEPTKEMAEKLKIRDPATGEMAGVKLSEEEVDAVIAALGQLCPEPIPETIPMPEAVRAAFDRWSCLSCHALLDQGPADGGIGKSLDHAGKRGAETLRAWFEDPSPENAEKLGISDNPMGAMEDIVLNEESREAMVAYLVDLHRFGPSESGESHETEGADGVSSN